MTTYTGKIEQSPNDKRTYRLVTLDNQLQVLLVSDPETEKSAACCDVNVGSLSDPKEALGLAHFLEHMLFMGTEKYPQENAYSAYLSNHGGSSNAYTDDENTVYYFDVLNNHFEGALDLFASFFTCPLFSESGVMREINAVDSENSKNLQSDPWRKYQLFKNLAREDHPLHTFSTGNLHTLHEIPQSKGTNIRQLMIDFYEKYYSANLMKVSIYGKESLDVLQQWAVEKFSTVPNKNNPFNHFPSDPFRPQDTRKIVEFVPVRDLKNLEIIFPFPPMEHLYRSKPDRYLSHLIGHESEGSILSALKQKSLANGLSSYLFQSSRDFACFAVNIELSNEGVEQVESIIQCVFTYIGMLKTQGVQDWVAQEIIETSQMKFNFLDKKEPADYVIRLANAMHYYEPSHTLSGNYLYYEKDLNTVEELIKLLTPENAVIMFSHKGLEGKTSLVEQWYSTKYNVKDFTPEQLATWKKEIEASESAWKDLLHLPKPNPFIPTDFTLYTVEHKGETFPTLLSKEGKSVIEVPETAVVAEEEKKDTAEASEPMEVTDGKEDEEGDEEEGDEEDDGEDEEDDEEQPSSGGSGAEPDIRSNILGVSNIIWKMEDSHWKVPKLNVIISLENQFATLGPWNIAMTDLLLSILKELLNEYSYYADCSGLYYYLRLNRGGIDMIFRGYHHKLPILIERVCKELKSLSEGENIELYKVLFERMKEKQLRNYKNTFYAQPYSHCILGSLLCLEEPRYTNQEKYLALQNITSIHEFLTFVKVFINQLKLEIFINGNFNINHVYKDIIEEKIVSILKCSSLPFGQQLSRRGVDIWQYSQSTGVRDFIYRQSAHHYNPNEVNSAIENVYMVGTLATVHDYNKEVKGNLPSYERDTIVKEALVQLFEQMMSEEAFDQLRTKEQLGYIVFTGMKRLAQNVAALHIIVQSHHKDPLYLNDRIENFLARYYEEVLKPMTEEKFNHFVHAVKEKLIEKPKNLDEETDRHWDEISNQTYLFNRNHLMVEKFDEPALITKEVAVEFFEKYLLASSSHRIKFSSQFFGGKTTFPSSNNVDPTKVLIIQDPNLFKRKLPLLSVLTADQF